jgi:hypothetical protein
MVIEIIRLFPLLEVASYNYPRWCVRSQGRQGTSRFAIRFRLGDSERKVDVSWARNFRVTHFIVRGGGHDQCDEL